MMATSIFVDIHDSSIHGNSGKMIDYCSLIGCVRITYMGYGYMVCERIPGSDIDDADLFSTSLDCFFNYNNAIKDYFIALEVVSYGKRYRFNKQNCDLNNVYQRIGLAKPYGEMLYGIAEIINSYLV